MTDAKADLNEPQSNTKEAAAQTAAVDRAAAARQIAEHEATIARLKLERARDDREAAKFSQSTTAEEAAVQETTLARMKLERATVERDLAKLAKPWWQSWNMTALGAFLAAIAPATAGVTGYFEKQKQLALEAQKQQHEIAMAQQKQDEEIRSRYLDRIVDPHQTRRTLRLLIATSSNASIRQWANNELPYIDSEEKLSNEARELLLKQANDDEIVLRRILDSDGLKKRLAESIAAKKDLAAKIEANRRQLTPD